MVRRRGWRGGEDGVDRRAFSEMGDRWPCSLNEMEGERAKYDERGRGMTSNDRGRNFVSPLEHLQQITRLSLQY